MIRISVSTRGFLGKNRILLATRQVLEHVHKAMDKKKIVSIRFDWVKYLVVWSRSGPGFYAGIRIAHNGEWPKEVSKYQSTR